MVVAVMVVAVRRRRMSSSLSSSFLSRAFDRATASEKGHSRAVQYFKSMHIQDWIMISITLRS